MHYHKGKQVYTDGRQEFMKAKWKFIKFAQQHRDEQLIPLQRV